MKNTFSIALDGPSGSGKSTIAKLLAKHYDILYLDTGAMYRACALKALKLGVNALDEQAVSKFINDIDLEIRYVDGGQRTVLDGIDVSDEIRMPQVSMQASNISSLRCVRIKMVEMQREIASGLSCILDGRDIGSHVLPNADFKFFVTADSSVRAMRRFNELKMKGFAVDYDEIYKEIIERDKNDSTREFSPLVRADDAVLVDTSDMSIDEVKTYIIDIIDQKL